MKEIKIERASIDAYRLHRLTKQTRQIRELKAKVETLESAFRKKCDDNDELLVANDALRADLRAAQQTIATLKQQLRGIRNAVVDRCCDALGSE